MPSPGITKRILAESMKKCMKERPLSKISVGDVVEDCGLNRNSFYYHFKDKYDLVNWIFYTEFVEALKEEDFTDTWDLIERICTYFYANRSFYSHALSENGQNSFTEYFYSMIESAVIARLSEALDTDESSESYEFYASFFVNPFISAVSKWLCEGAKTEPSEFAGLVKKAVAWVSLVILKETPEAKELIDTIKGH